MLAISYPATDAGTGSWVHSPVRHDGSFCFVSSGLLCISVTLVHAPKEYRGISTAAAAQVIKCFQEFIR